jgi:hypothetical protein
MLARRSYYAQRIRCRCSRTALVRVWKLGRLLTVESLLVEVNVDFPLPFPGRLYEERQQLNSRVLSDLEPQLFGPAASTTEATKSAAADMLQVRAPFRNEASPSSKKAYTSHAMSELRVALASRRVGLCHEYISPFFLVFPKMVGIKKKPSLKLKNYF